MVIHCGILNLFVVLIISAKQKKRVSLKKWRGQGWRDMQNCVEFLQRSSLALLEFSNFAERAEASFFLDSLHTFSLRRKYEEKEILKGINHNSC